MTTLDTIPLEDLLAEVRRRRTLIDSELPRHIDASRAIIRAVAAAFHVPATSLWSSGRRAEPTSARQAAMVLMREQLGMSYEDIAEAFRKDHTTVLYAVRTQPHRMTDRAYASAYRQAAAALPAHI